MSYQFSVCPSQPPPQPHNSVQGRLCCLHLHRVEHLILQLHFTSSVHAWEASGNVIQIGETVVFSHLHSHSSNVKSGVILLVGRLHHISPFPFLKCKIWSDLVDLAEMQRNLIYRDSTQTRLAASTSFRRVLVC